MNQKRVLGLGLVIVGAILLYFGFNQANSALGEISETLTGKYSDETMTYLISGGAALLVGLFTLGKK